MRERDRVRQGEARLRRCDVRRRKSLEEAAAMYDFRQAAAAGEGARLWPSSSGNARLTPLRVLITYISSLHLDFEEKNEWLCCHGGCRRWQSPPADFQPPPLTYIYFITRGLIMHGYMAGSCIKSIEISSLLRLIL